MALVLKRGERSRLQFDWRHFRRSRAVEQLHPVVFHVADVTAAYLALYSIADRSSIFWAAKRRTGRRAASPQTPIPVEAYRQLCGRASLHFVPLSNFFSAMGIIFAQTSLNT